MAISLLDNIAIKKKSPNVERDLFATIADMVAYNENYLPDVFECNVIEDGNRYRYNRTNIVDENLGRWRIVESGGSANLIDYYKKTETDALLEGYVAKEDGKGLSANDLTDELKEKYDKAEENVQSDWNETDETSDAFIKNKPTIPSIDGLATETFVTNKIAEAQLNGSDVDISGLATKEELATKADITHTHTLADVTDYEAPDLSNYALKTDIPSTEGFVTEESLSTTLEEYAKSEEITEYDDTALVERVGNVETVLESKADVTDIPDVSNFVEKEEGKGLFSGSYNDLADKPTIPSVEGLVSEETLNTTLADYVKTDELPDGYDDTALTNRVKTIEDDYLTSTDKTELTTAIATAKSEAIETVLGESVDADFDTLKEVANWIQSDTTASAELVTRVTNVEKDIDSLETFVNNKVDKVSGKGLSTNDYTTSEKNKLSGIASGAEVNVQSDWNVTDTTSDAFIKNKPTIPTKTSQLTNDSGFKTTDNNTTYSLSKSGSTITLTGSDGSTTSVTDSNTTYSNFVKSGSGAKAGLVPAPSTTAGTTKYLREDGTWTTPPDNNTTYSNMTAATASAAGKAGLVPAPAAGKQASFLRGDGTWAVPTNTTYGAAGSALGLVKSGGDVTISDGVITVNDDSHAHVISNVDGLQAALDGKSPTSHTHSAYANQNAFSNIKVGDTTIAADTTTDTVTLVGSNVTITPDATNDKVTIAITKDNVTKALGYTPPTTNTTYSNFVKSGSGAKAGLVPAPSTTAGTTKYLREDGTWTTPPDTNTDTKNTAGSTDSSSKLFLVGATSQAANPQTYSHDTAYVGTDGHVYSNSKQTVNLSDTQALTNKTYNGYTLAAACAKAVTDSTSASAIGTGTSLVTERDVYYGLPTINGSHTYSSSTNIYAPTAVGSSGQVLKSNGSGSPSWSTLKNLDALVCTKTTVATKSTAKVLSAGGPPSNTHDWYLIGAYNGAASAIILVWWHNGKLYLPDFTKSSATISSTDFGFNDKRLILSSTSERGTYIINLTNNDVNSSTTCLVWRFTQ